MDFRAPKFGAPKHDAALPVEPKPADPITEENLTETIDSTTTVLPPEQVEAVRAIAAEALKPQS